MEAVVEAAAEAVEELESTEVFEVQVVRVPGRDRG